MIHTIYFKIPAVMVKIECDSDETLDYVIDEMLALDGKVVNASEFDEEKVFNVLHKGTSIMSVISEAG